MDLKEADALVKEASLGPLGSGPPTDAPGLLRYLFGEGGLSAFLEKPDYTLEWAQKRMVGAAWGNWSRGDCTLMTFCLDEVGKKLAEVAEQKRLAEVAEPPKA